jgi:hypothetical protein
LLKSIKEIERATEAFRDALTRRDAADVVRAEAHLKTVRRLAATTARGLGLDCPY